MNAKEYSALALRTANSLGTPMKDTFHATLGMAGESGEIVDLLKKVYAYGKPLDRTKLLEEIGDLMWYVNLFTVSVGGGLKHLIQQGEGISEDVVMEYFGDRKSERLMLGTAAMISQAASTANAAVHLMEAGMCGTLDEETLMLPVKGVIGGVQDLLHALDSSFDEVFEMNIRKLETRYPNLRFEADKAINRDVDAEQKVLQG